MKRRTSRKRHRPEEVFTKLRQADEALANGAPIAEVATSLGVFEAKGLTPPLPVSDLEPFVLSVRAKGYKEWRGAPLWRTLDDQMVRRIEMRRE